MATNYAVRVTRSYEQCARGVAAAALLCDKALVYEHVGDATEKVHIHMMLIGVRCDKKTIQASFSYLALKGNQAWSWKTKDAKYGAVEDSVTYVTYMTKGKFDPKYNKGYTTPFLEDAKRGWVDMKKKSPQLIEYEKFCLLVPKDLPQHSELVQVGTKMETRYVGFNRVRDLAFAYAMEKCGVASPKAKMLTSMLYRTYCYRHGIDMDPKFDTW